MLGPFNSHAKIYHWIPTFNKLTHNFKLSVTLENKHQSLKVMFFKIQSTSRLPRLLIKNAYSWAQSQPYRISISSSWNMEYVLLISSPHTYYSCQNLKTVALICINKFILILVNRQKGVKYEVLQFLSHFIRPTNYWKLWRWRNDLDSGGGKKKKTTMKKTEKQKMGSRDKFLSFLVLPAGNPVQVCISWWKSLFGI